MLAFISACCFALVLAISAACRAWWQTVVEQYRDVVPYTMVQHGTALHGKARQGTARHGTAQHGTARHGKMHITAKYSTVMHGTARTAP